MTSKSVNIDSSAASEGTLTFEVDCGLLFQLGEGAVNKRSVALAELIKNAYDADATRVAIEFHNVSKVGGEITILDNGTGMSFSRIRDTWMRIATTEKEFDPVSQVYRRPLAGAKGIGRFATRRLSAELELVSVSAVDPKKASESKEETAVFFDWEKFVPGEDVGSVGVHYERRVVRRSATGVLLRLTRA